MRFHSRAFAGTALGLLMAASSASASGVRTDTAGNSTPGAIVVAQADNDAQDQNQKKKDRRAERQAEKKAHQQEGNGDQGAAAQGGEQPSQGSERPKHQRQNMGQQQGNEGGQTQNNARQAPANDEAPAMKPNRKNRHSDEAGGQDMQGGNDNNAPAMSKRKHGQQGEEQKPETNQKPAAAQNSDNAQSPDQGNEMKRDKKHRRDKEMQGQQKQEEPSKAETQKPAEAQKPAENAKPDNSGKEAQTPETKRDHKGRQTDETRKSDQNDNTQAGQGAGEQQKGQNAEQKGQKSDQKNEEAGQNGAGKPILPSNAGTRQVRPGEKPAMQGQDQNGEKGNGQNAAKENGQKRPDMNQAGNNPLPDNAAPVLDSNKHRHGRNGNDQAGDNNRHGERNGQNADNNNQAPEKAGPPPKSDAAAQDFRGRGKIEVQSIDTLKGKRIEGDHRPQWERRKDSDVVKKFGDRVIINLGGQTIVENTDHDRLRVHARDTYYEDLPRGRVRETIERPDGTRVVTIRNQYGDVIRRSRFTSGGQEVVLVYVDDRDLDRDRGGDWRDPGDDLPPMRLGVPVSQYILDSDNVRDPDRYYEFLDQPPVDHVERLYTLGDVRRSARVRDMMPRIDLDTINFDTGSADISQDQVDDLEGVANAMKRIIDRNPGETFLIEGHTDAVGDANSNLALSDERAESVAAVLSKDFEIPPENLVTQGYGEEYLKVDTDGPSRVNRRVAIRRITPLVSPVAQR